jgi:hypothetical protein
MSNDDVQDRSFSTTPGQSSPPTDRGLLGSKPINPTREAIQNAPRRAPPAPPSANTLDEIIATPATAPMMTRNNSITANDLLSRKNSTRADKEDDEEKRRDFEARIAAATAALNRTPSLSAARLERKGTKTRGPMVISSPTLVSSSIKLPSSPRTPPDGVDPVVAKAMEKASGSSSKMSWRWKKFKSRKGLSFSGDVASPTTPMPPLPKREEHKLDGPIALRKEDVVAPVNGNGVKTEDSPDLNAFKFPPTSAMSMGTSGMGQKIPAPPQSANPASELQQRMSEESRLRSAEAALKPAHSIDAPTPNMTAHSQASSFDDAAMAKFIQAGRGLGLNDEQLNEMLAQKGVLNRSTTSVSSRSYQSTAPTTNSFSQPSPSVASPILTPAMSEKAAKTGGGLFRSLSKGRKGKQQDIPAQTDVEPVPSRNVVVRRTLLIPTIEAIPSTPQLNAASPLLSSESPDRFIGGRKMSVKRKPLNLTPQDRELVSSSPNRDKFGVVDESGGLLRPRASPGGSGLGISDGSVGSRSSGGAGSFYDLYGDGGEEVLGSPEREVSGGDGGSGVRASKAVEIT